MRTCSTKCWRINTDWKSKHKRKPRGESSYDKLVGQGEDTSRSAITVWVMTGTWIDRLWILGKCSHKCKGNCPGHSKSVMVWMTTLAYKLGIKCLILSLRVWMVSHLGEVGLNSKTNLNRRNSWLHLVMIGNDHLKMKKTGKRQRTIFCCEVHL